MLEFKLELEDYPPNGLKCVLTRLPANDKPIHITSMAQWGDGHSRELITEFIRDYIERQYNTKEYNLEVI